MKTRQISLNVNNLPYIKTEKFYVTSHESPYKLFIYYITSCIKNAPLLYALSTFDLFVCTTIWYVHIGKVGYS